MSTNPSEEMPGRVTAWVSLVVLAGALLVLSGVFTLIQALYALVDDAVFVQADGQPILLNIATWGWVHLVLGVLAAATGVALMQGATWARAVAVGFVMLNMLTQLLFLPAYPFWSLLIIVLDVVVLWALIVHGDEQIA